ncbi:hypothetical protein NP493_489g03076 [Ridgeia piscesae]|uniref:Uncharacterized protein n=1 Tax=Ridgeia piscesae TaxID=27915 RepID=A0AAD9KY27_RIDPI|nr:hypothetical protein NP493_489g03076 [Ridgeia piscesae]
MTTLGETQKDVAKSKPANAFVISEELETLRTAVLQEKNLNECMKTELATHIETENKLLAELNERKEDYVRMVHEYSKKDEECEDLKKKLTYREEEANYYQNRACDLALEYNGLLDTYQRVRVQTTRTALITRVSC